MTINPELDLAPLDTTIDFDTPELPESKPTPSPKPDSKVRGDDAGPTIMVSTKAPAVPPPKTDKPRPHICTTCERCFARLEHLKRHERSHTKEKPFECAQCTRCFARRDLLLRHQQKLHQATTPAARPRNRRESTASAAAGRARKNSIAGVSCGPGTVAGNSSAANARPRANTTGHVDGASSLATFAANVPLARRLGTSNLADFSLHHSLSFNPSSAMPYGNPTNSSILGMPSLLAQRGLNHGPPKLETHISSGLDFSGGLRTAPAMSFFNQDLDFENVIFGSAGGNTINPSALHADSPQSLALDPTSAFARRTGAYNDMPSTRDSFDWLTGFENQMSFISANESAVDGSSPSAISTGSQSDIMLDGSTHLHNGSISMPPPVSAISSTGHSVPTTLPTSMWQTSTALNTRPLADSGFLGAHPLADSSFATELGTTDFSDLLTGISVSPHMAVSALGLHTNQTIQSTQAPLSSNATASSRTGDPFFSTPPPSMSSLSPSLLNMNAALGQTMGMGGGNGPDTPMSMNGSSGSVSSNGNNAASGGSSSPVSTITDATRHAIVKALTSSASRNSSFGIRRYSFSGVGSPNAPSSIPGLEHPVPSTSDLQRYVAAYLQNIQPFMPFLHVSTLSFDVSSNMLSALTSYGRNNSIGASGCLVLSMAAIGALFELDRDQSRILFSMAKRMIQVYLDERRKANVRKADYRRTSVGEPTDDSADTPVWLVQAMLLNVMYGHNSADMRACEIASTHSAALASLAHGAQLLKPVRIEPLPDIPIDIWGDNSTTEKSPQRLADEKTLWLRWKSMEERKRTLFAVFVMSSLFMTAYNHTPVLTNSEILLDLPCDEVFFAAASSSEFESLGGVSAANHNRMTFHEALGSLLRSSEKQMQRNILNSMGNKGARDALEKLAAITTPDLKPSRFGCNILINALHNYIWETRQRHHNKFWTNEETEKMHRHIEPAMEAWQVAWKRCAQNSTDFQDGLYGPLSTNAMPLLDLAYVRLFVNLGPSKHKFWQRDWDGLAEEISHGWEMVQHAEQSPVSNAESLATDPSSDASGHNSSVFADSPATQHSESPGFGSSMFSHPQQKASLSRSTSRREKHLRKAAYCAANSMTSADRLGLTLIVLSTGVLPLHFALCFFDCTQVLAEWVATVQDRVGPYLGILGRDEVDLTQVPAIMMLDDEDVKLLGRVQEFLTTAESAANLDLSNGHSTGGISLGIQVGEQIGFAAKILSTTAALLGRAHVWPVTALMVECLENHAAHMRARAEKSVLGQHFSQ